MTTMNLRMRCSWSSGAKDTRRAKNEQVTRKPPEDTDARTGCTVCIVCIQRVSVTLPFPFLLSFLKHLKKYKNTKITKELEPALRKKIPQLANENDEETKRSNQDIARSKVTVPNNYVRLLLTKTPKISTDRQKETKKEKFS